MRKCLTAINRQKMKVPTITQFNAWSEKDKLFWINYETDGSYKWMTRSKGYFPILVYPAENVGIVYEVNASGNIVEATAMTAAEATDRVQRYATAATAMRSTN